jgi:hypothetical protein
VMDDDDGERRLVFTSIPPRESALTRMATESSDEDEVLLARCVTGAGRNDGEGR